jgi:hypothetical protein
VIGHANTVVIADPQFVVSAKGRDRVRAERQKNVHAFVRGELVSADEATVLVDEGKVSYNPYKNETFVKDGDPIRFTYGYAVLHEDFTIGIA